MTHALTHIERSTNGWTVGLPAVYSDGDATPFDGVWRFSCSTHDSNLLASFVGGITYHTIARPSAHGYTPIVGDDEDWRIITVSAVSSSGRPRMWPFVGGGYSPSIEVTPITMRPVENMTVARIESVCDRGLDDEYAMYGTRPMIADNLSSRMLSSVRSVAPTRIRLTAFGRSIGFVYLADEPITRLESGETNNTNNTGDNTMPTNNTNESTVEVYDCVVCNEAFAANSEPTYYYGNIDGYVCDDCVDDVRDCDRCGESNISDNLHVCDVHSRYSDRLCEYCYDEWEAERERDARANRAENLIHGYSYKPTTRFINGRENSSYHPTLNTLYMGVELEIEAGECSDWESVLTDMTATAYNSLSVGDVWYAKHDGSIQDGFECVSHPLTIDAWRALDLSWMERAATEGCRSWNTRSCGLHVHLSLSAFDNRSHFARWWLLHERNWEQWVTLAGRHSTTYASWNRGMEGMAVRRAYGVFPHDPYSSPFAPPAPNYHVDSPEVIERKEFEREMYRKYRMYNRMANLGERNYERYCAINVQNTHTAEQRFWRPSLKVNTMLATLEVIQAAFDYTRTLTVIDSKGTMKDRMSLLEWDSFRQWVGEHSTVYPYADARIAARFGEGDTQDMDA